MLKKTNKITKKKEFDLVFLKGRSNFNKYLGVKKVIMDLQESKVVNSIGISYLIEIIEKLNESNGKLYFLNLDPTIEKTFSIMGLFQFAEKTDSVEDALSK